VANCTTANLSRMLSPFRADIGPYSILLPGSATLDVNIRRAPPEAYQMANTQWVVGLRRFQIFVHLDARHELGGLKDFIDYQTRGNVVVDQQVVNDIAGVRHGSYGMPRTWIDWWFKKGDTMICLCLQSVSFPVTEPSDDERAEHYEVIQSLKFIPDSPLERPPVPT
jgi:hypothetical protein